MSAGKVFLIVIGSVFALLGVGFLIAGAMGVRLEITFSDPEGFLTSKEVSFTADSYAIVTSPANIGVDWPWWFETVGTLRVKVAATALADQVFAGIGPYEEVRTYLSEVEYEEIAEFEHHPYRVEYRRHPGTATPMRPVEQTFWRTSATGSGTQTLTWDPEPGKWVLVVMNADASRGIDVEGSVGVRVPWLLGAVIGLLAGGLGALAGGLALILVSARAGQAGPYTEPSAPVGYPLVFTGELTEPLSPVLWLVKWFLLIPHYILLTFLWAGFVMSWVVSLLAILITGRYPRGLFEYNAGVLRWTWRVGFYSYQALGTDRYPPFTLRAGGYPVDLNVPYPGRLSRGLALVKWWLLALPHYLVIGFFQGGGGQHSGAGLVVLLSLFGGVALLFRGRYPRDIFDFVVGMNRWTYRVAIYAALMTDRYPPFRLGE